ncbi:MAG: hypothetical protein ABI836_03015 [Gemmatimonadota bacterium]
MTTVFVACFLLLALLALHSPGAELDGQTLCLPVLGPVQQFDPALSGRARRLTEVHEAMHAEQCRRLGSLADYLIRIGVRGRVRMEAQAYCVQAVLEMSWGMTPAALMDRIEEELAIAVAGRTFGRMTGPEIRALLAAECPAIAPPSASTWGVRSATNMH